MAHPFPHHVRGDLTAIEAAVWQEARATHTQWAREFEWGNPKGAILAASHQRTAAELHQDLVASGWAA